MFSNIVVPVDGSAPSFRALNVALSFSKALGSKISVIHVMEIVPITHIQSQKLLDKLEAYKKEAQDMLSKCSEIAKEKGVTINTILLQGNPASKILDFSKDEKCDTIIIGSRGMGKFKELILGSVSSKIVHHSLCSVMLVK